MALISLFFQTKAKLGQMELDASLQENHEAMAQVTDNEIEDGANVNDHVRLLPLKLSIEGIVSKSPLGLNALIGSATSTASGALAAGATVGMIGLASVGGLVANSFGPNGGPKSREPSDVYAYLLELYKARLPIDVVTALTLYSSMVITGVSVPRNVANVNVMRFTVQMQQVTLVQSEVVDLGTMSSLGGAAGSSKALGPQAVSAADGAKGGNNASILYNLFGGGL